MFVLAHNSARAFGGGEIGTVLLLAGLQRRGHRVLMLFRDEQNAARGAGYGIPTGVQRVGGDAMLPDALRLAARLRRERPDAVLLTSFKKVMLAGLGARMAGAPFVVQRIVLQGDTPARGRRYRIALRRLVDRVVLNADAMRPAFLAGDRQLDPAKVLTIVDGVRAPPRTREPGAVRRELGIPPDARVVGSVARMASQKRFDRLLRALALLPEPVHCIIAGEGEAMEPTREVAALLGMADRVHLLGFRRDVGDVLDAFDVFVVSSDREGMANAMLEAMAFGLPVVSTEVSGAREALDASSGEPAAGIVTGFHEDQVAEAVAALLRDPGARKRLGEAARARAERRFGEERFLDEWERLLADGIAAARGGG
ncbi:MAG TPA: glycosyltransferase [Longimicrobium sp.]|nr:glycosyltransferase [Longimicrobium sp.]